MQTYEVTGPLVTFGPQQVLALSAAQIDARAYCLEPVDDEPEGVVRSTGLVQFKRGEVVQIPEAPDDLPGIIASQLKVLGDGAKPKKAAKSNKSVNTNAPPAVDLDALEEAIDEAEAALAAVDPADTEAVEKAQAAADAAKAALEAALS